MVGAGGTALSSGEVGLGYKEVLDPSVYVAFPIKPCALGEGLELLVWTTTPWTLPSNMFVAVNAAFDYAVVRLGNRRFVVAEKLVPGLAKKLKVEPVVEKVVGGASLGGIEYEAPYAGDYEGARALNTTVSGGPGTRASAFWRVIVTDFVSLDAGTGLVHVAPAFGEDDHRAFVRENTALGRPDAIPMLCAVAPDGTFNDRLPGYRGRWVKDCDKDILAELKGRGLLVHTESYKHDYPFCWRSDQDPLIQYARPAWYIRTTQLKDDAIRNNRAVNWLPEHIKEGRFGDFLAHNVDWALSRERYWGTPLNVWICSRTKGTDGEHQYAPTSAREIEEKNPHAFDRFRAARKADPSLSEHLIVHKPWIDDVVFPCPTCGAEMRRVPEVIDCWFDSGCMPFAQWGFPHKGQAEFRAELPGRLHLRGDRPDARLVLLAAHDLDARLRRADERPLRALGRLSASLQDVHRARARLGQGGEEGEQIARQLHASGDHPRRGPDGLRGDREGRGGVAEGGVVEGGGRGGVHRRRGHGRARPDRRCEGRAAGAGRGGGARARGEEGAAATRDRARGRHHEAARRRRDEHPRRQARGGSAPADRTNARPSSTRRPRRREPTRSAGSSTRPARRGTPRATRSPTSARSRRSSWSSCATSSRSSPSTPTSTASTRTRPRLPASGPSSIAGSWSSSPGRSRP